MNLTLRMACLAAAGAAGIAASHAAIAQDNFATRSPREAVRGWTDADFATAKPLLPKLNALPAAAFDHNAAIAEAALAVSEFSVAGSRGGADARHLYEERLIPKAFAATDGGIAPQAVGTGGLPFTSTRTFPNASDKTYPTRTVGKLYFRVGGSNSVCSGSMIKPGVVLTSGHCIHDGSTGFYTDFVFVPGLRNGVRPYGTWSNWIQIRTTTAWITGGGGVPNTADWATIVFGPDGSGNRIGNYTGWLGYQSARCIGRHVTTLGYPVNLDGGLQMHRSDAQATSYGGSNTCLWGTDMTGGSSGGPVVQNLQVAYTNSSSLPLENEPNRAVSTVSWGYTNPAIKTQGGNTFNGTFNALITATCNANPSAC